MDKFLIKSNGKLYGSINVPGAKNSALPIMAASILSQDGLILNNLPNLNDIQSMIKLLQSFGLRINFNRSNCQTCFSSSKLKNNVADYNLVRKMRASILILGPLIARFKKARISLPGGCAIGNRPIDIHLFGLKKLGVKVAFENGFVNAVVDKILIGNVIDLPFPSVGATENLIMASCLAKGRTIINNAAKEPEIKDLAMCLNKMGAKITGAGKKTIEIKGVENLKKAEHSIISDRIVAGSYIILAIMLNKKFLINNFDPSMINTPLKILNKMGAKLKITNNSVLVEPSKKIKGINIETKPYPGFPSDLQAQIMALMSIAKGNSKIREKIFENRFMHVSELNRMGASIKIKNDTAFIEGNRRFKGAQVMASDLRASMSLVLAALSGEGKTEINRVYHIDRGYEKIEETLKKCGPNISRLKK